MPTPPSNPPVPRPPPPSLPRSPSSPPSPSLLSRHLPPVHTIFSPLSLSPTSLHLFLSYYLSPSLSFALPDIRFHFFCPSGAFLLPVVRLAFGPTSRSEVGCDFFFLSLFFLSYTGLLGLCFSQWQPSSKAYRPHRHHLSIPLLLFLILMINSRFHQLSHPRPIHSQSFHTPSPSLQENPPRRVAKIHLRLG